MVKVFLILQVLCGATTFRLTSSDLLHIVAAANTSLHRTPDFGYAYFVFHPNSLLEIENPHQFHAESYKPCAVACATNMTCLSFNFGKKPIFFYQGRAQYLCELLPTDKYNSSFKYQSRNQDFDHYSIRSNCSKSPCLHNFTCIANYTEDIYECLCPRPAFEGKHCKDVNECTTGQHDCSPNATCTNTIGSYNCTCKNGYIGNGKTCLEVTYKWLKINTHPVCFGAKNSSYGSLYIRENGAVTTVKLVHLSGYVACFNRDVSKRNNWGCETATSEKFLNAIITTNTDQRIFPQDEFITNFNVLFYQLPDTTTTSPELIFKKFITPMNVAAGQEFRIWYGEDLKKIGEENNEGTSCTHVYMYGFFGF